MMARGMFPRARLRKQSSGAAKLVLPLVHKSGRLFAHAAHGVSEIRDTVIETAERILSLSAHRLAKAGHFFAALFT